MAEEEPKKVETETPSEPLLPPPDPEPAEAFQDVAEEKSVIPPPPTEEKPAESTELAAVESIFLSFSLSSFATPAFYFFCFFLCGLIFHLSLFFVNLILLLVFFPFILILMFMAEAAESTEEKSREGSVNRGNFSLMFIKILVLINYDPVNVINMINLKVFLLGCLSRCCAC